MCNFGKGWGLKNLECDKRPLICYIDGWLSLANGIYICVIIYMLPIISIVTQIVKSSSHFKFPQCNYIKKGFRYQFFYCSYINYFCYNSFFLELDKPLLLLLFSILSVAHSTAHDSTDRKA